MMTVCVILEYLIQIRLKTISALREGWFEVAQKMKEYFDMRDLAIPMLSGV